MPNHPGFVLNSGVAKRLGKVLRDFEAGRLTNRDQVVDHQATPGSTGFFVVAGDPVAGWPAGYHYATLEMADPYTGDWFELPESAMVYELNGKALAKGEKYQGNFLETVVSDGGEATAVFAVNLSGGGTVTQTDVVVDVQCVNGEIFQTKKTINHIQ
jgi:hypothetical protein